MTEPQLRLIEPGDIFEQKSRWNEAKQTRINREYEVVADGEVIGYVKRVMVTRERRAPGQRYVLARWRAPGWKYYEQRHGRGLECSSAKAGARILAQARAMHQC